MQKMIRIVMLATALAFLSGCVTEIKPKHLDLSVIKAPSLVLTANPDLFLTPEFGSFSDEITAGQYVVYTFPTGEVASQLFTGKPNGRWNISRLSSQLTVGGGNYLPFPGSFARARYSVTCVISDGIKRVPLHADAESETINNLGPGGTTATLTQALRMAVERALIDIGNQAKIVAN